jgi:hypothetical protein
MKPLDLGMAVADFERLGLLGQTMVRIERRHTGYAEGPGAGERKCASCVRKRYGGPSCCDEGWERFRARARGGDPGGCLNWIGWDEDLGGPQEDER